ncbi:MAG TPA: M23 family metallopeptidase [Gemmatimonadaceae bacterium]|jgi:murein DD-endopeptidase MepM/ murein hydrolase activator NlpD
MGADRRWTIMLVPNGCDAARSVTISAGALRRTAQAAGAMAILVALSVGVGLTRSKLSVHAPLAPSPAFQARLDGLLDTIETIARRDEQIRLLAGLPQDSVAALLSDHVPDSLFVQREGIAEHPSLEILIRRANSLAASFAEVSDTLSQHADRLSHIPSIMPTAGWLSSAFSRSRFHPILHIARPHEGIDVSAPMGAPIVAPAAGTVTMVTVQTGYGNVLEIDHGGGIVTKYAHCSRIVVRVGQRVKRGQVIANVGNTGLSTGPHLHYEIHVQGKVVDPLTYVLPAGAIPD